MPHDRRLKIIFFLTKTLGFFLNLLSLFIFSYRSCMCVYLECLTHIFCKPRWQQLTIDIEEIQHPSLQRLLCFPLAMFHLNSKIYIFFKSCTRKVIGKYRHAWCLSNNLAKILTVKVIFLFVKKNVLLKTTIMLIA